MGCLIGSADTGADFRDLACYLPREGEDAERVARKATRNLIVGERDAAMLMDDTAAQSARVDTRHARRGGRGERAGTDRGAA